MNMNGVVYWITGLSGSGKTTIGSCLYYEFRKNNDNVVLLDGDVMKSVFLVDQTNGYTTEKRRERAFQYASLCKLLADQGMCVICCTIAMYEDVRKWNRINNKYYVEVFLDVDISTLKKRNQKGLYKNFDLGMQNNLVGMDITPEFPQNPDIILQNDGRFSVKECVERIKSIQIIENKEFARDSEYWNMYYQNENAPTEHSLFADFVLAHMKDNGTVIDLGCGNGRDSLFFAKYGYNVIGIDASESVIIKLNHKYSDLGNAYFINDDFVTSASIYARQYDYCYSRFTIHAINDSQEEELIGNVFNSLKEGGKFFIEVRSINDPMFGKGEKVGRNAYIYTGHYRRFIVLSELSQKLENAGFVITYKEERTGFAPYQGEDPSIIRLIAEKI